MSLPPGRRSGRLGLAYRTPAGGLRRDLDDGTGAGTGIDVTSVLVGSALVTALLQALAGTASLAPQALGILLVFGGAGSVLWASRKGPVAPRGEAAAR